MKNKKRAFHHLFGIGGKRVFYLGAQQINQGFSAYFSRSVGKYPRKEGIAVKVTKQEYSKLTDQASPGSPSFKNIPMAFLVGGLICALGQLIFNLYQQTGLNEQDSRAAVSVTLVALGAILTALKIYDNIAKHAGAGTLVPITGFSNAIVSPAIEFKSEGFVMGIGAKMFVIAGPVLVYGIIASIVYGVVLWVAALY